MLTTLLIAGSNSHPQGVGRNPGPYFSSLKWGEKVKYPGFWKTVDYIRRTYRWVEIRYGTKGLLKITRDLMDEFRYMMIYDGLEYAREHWYQCIDEYIKTGGNKHGTQNYLLATEEYERLRYQFTEH